MSTSSAAIVTGGASGLGLEITKSLLSQGWSVVIADINPTGETVAKSLGSEVLFIKTDTSVWEEQVKLFARGELLLFSSFLKASTYTGSFCMATPNFSPGCKRWNFYRPHSFN